jgi:hypothetical protein
MVKATLAIIKDDHTWEELVLDFESDYRTSWGVLKLAIESRAAALLISDEVKFRDVCLLEVAVVRS